METISSVSQQVAHIIGVIPHEVPNWVASWASRDYASVKLEAVKFKKVVATLADAQVTDPLLEDSDLLFYGVLLLAESLHKADDITNWERFRRSNVGLGRHQFIVQYKAATQVQQNNRLHLTTRHYATQLQDLATGKCVFSKDIEAHQREYLQKIPELIRVARHHSGLVRLVEFFYLCCLFPYAELSYLLEVAWQEMERDYSPSQQVFMGATNWSELYQEKARKLFKFGISFSGTSSSRLPAHKKILAALLQLEPWLTDGQQQRAIRQLRPDSPAGSIENTPPAESIYNWAGLYQQPPLQGYLQTAELESTIAEAAAIWPGLTQLLADSSAN